MLNREERIGEEERTRTTTRSVSLLSRKRVKVRLVVPPPAKPDLNGYGVLVHFREDR